jgi:hypothetical protein
MSLAQGMYPEAISESHRATILAVCYLDAFAHGVRAQSERCTRSPRATMAALNGLVVGGTPHAAAARRGGQDAAGSQDAVLNGQQRSFLGDADAAKFRDGGVRLTEPAVCGKGALD